MTCIVGLEHNGNVFIGADSAASDGWEIHEVADPKVFKNGKFIMGYTTSFRFGQLLQYSLTVVKQRKKQSDLEYMSTTFINSVRTCLKDGGFLQVVNSQETGGSALIGYKGRLYMMETDLQIRRCKYGIASVGSGSTTAGAIIYYLKDATNIAPNEKLEIALRTASEMITTVCAPFIIKKK